MPFSNSPGHIWFSKSEDWGIPVVLNDVLIFKTLLTGAMSIYTSTFLTMQVSANAHNPSPLLVYFETAKHS